jgi:hypothetical protein
MQGKIDFLVILSAALPAGRQGRILFVISTQKKKILRRTAPQNDNEVKFFRSLYKQFSTFLRRLF